MSNSAPGFWKHLFVGLCANGIALGSFIWFASEAWSQREARLSAVEEKVSTHQSDTAQHATIESATRSEGRLQKLETTQEEIKGDVEEIKGDVKGILRLLRRGARSDGQ